MSLGHANTLVMSGRPPGGLPDPKTIVTKNGNKRKKTGKNGNKREKREFLDFFKKKYIHQIKMKLYIHTDINDFGLQVKK